MNNIKEYRYWYSTGGENAVLGAAGHLSKEFVAGFDKTRIGTTILVGCPDYDTIDSILGPLDATELIPAGSMNSLRWGDPTPTMHRRTS